MPPRTEKSSGKATRKQHTVLITGFGPFPGAPVNPTSALVSRLAKMRGRSARCIAHVFATRYAAIDHELPALLKKYQPDAIVMFGLAARSKLLRIETQARNRISVWFPDTSGESAVQAAIEKGAPSSLKGRAPFPRLLYAARSTGMKTVLSRNAGSYACNYLYWRALTAATENPGNLQLAVFIHVPQVRRKPMPRMRTKRRAVTFNQLLRAADAVVTAAIAELKR